MSKKNIFFILLLTFITKGCTLFSIAPDVLLKKEFTGESVAVLNFTKQGSYLPSDAGKIAADKLTDAMFLIGKFSVIDRSKVNEAQVGFDIKTTEFLSADDIQKLGMKLKANFIVLGRIQHVSENEYLNMNTKKELYISFRIISVKDTEVIGVASYYDNYSSNFIEKVDDMMRKIIKGMLATD